MNNKSFSIIEVIVAIFLITVGAGAAFILIQQNIAIASINTSQLKAAYLAQESIEAVRMIRDSNWLLDRDWTTGLAAGDYYFDFRSNPFLLPPTSDNVVVYDYGGSIGKRYVNYAEISCLFWSSVCQDTPFRRRVEISYPQPDTMELRGIIEWRERGSLHLLIVQTYLYNWR